MVVVNLCNTVSDESWGGGGGGEKRVLVNLSYMYQFDFLVSLCSSGGLGSRDPCAGKDFEEHQLLHPPGGDEDGVGGGGCGECSGGG